jgi:molecular chaperone GrpE
MTAIQFIRMHGKAISVAPGETAFGLRREQWDFNVVSQWTDPAETDAKTLHEGVELVQRKIWKDLESAGVSRIDQTGVPFDPNLHEAVTMQPAPKPELDHTVGQVVQPGYKLRDVLLRPARVVVFSWQGH